MVKTIVFLAAVCAAGWYYFIGGAQLDEAMVRQFYADEAHATLSRDPEALCKLFASKLVVRAETVMLGQTSTETLNQKQACDGQRKSFKMFEDIGVKADGILTIDYEYYIEKIEIAANRKSASVQMTSMLNMGNGMMVFKSSSTEQLTREWGKVLVLKADLKSKVTMHLAAVADPGKFLKEQ
jgi:hypothetical protein